MNVVELARLIESSPLGATSELHLQNDLERLFRGRGISASREHILSQRDRPDFMVGTIAVEVKIHGSVNSVARQLERYAEHACVEQLLLVTTRIQLARIPRMIGGKFARVAAILGGL